MMDWLTGVALAGAILPGVGAYVVILLICRVVRRRSNKTEITSTRAIRLPERQRSF
jgi:hypothetical protein